MTLLPLVHIEEEVMWEGMKKYHIRGLPFDAVIHHFTKPDLGEPHDHPWDFRSVILKGCYVEEVYKYSGQKEYFMREEGNTFYVSKSRIHRIIHLPEGECFTLVIPQLQFGIQKSSFYRWVNGVIQYRFWDAEYPAEPQ